VTVGYVNNISSAVRLKLRQMATHRNTRIRKLSIIVDTTASAQTLRDLPKWVCHYVSDNAWMFEWMPWMRLRSVIMTFESWDSSHDERVKDAL
jgi:hypothetical protein